MTEITAKAPFSFTGFIKPLISDRALISIFVTLSIIGFISVEQLSNTLVFTAETLLLLSPFLILAFALSAYMKASSAEAVVAQVFQGRTVAMIFAAAFFGAWSPLCSCSVIALIAVLLRSGMPLSAVMAFWIASPIISPDMYIYTAALLGIEFATVKLLSAAVMGLLGGGAILLLENRGFFHSPLKQSNLYKNKELDSSNGAVWKFWKEPARVSAFWSEYKNVAWKLGKWMIFAFILESLMMSYVPAENISSWFAYENTWAIPLATIAGIPAYINGIAAIPLIQGLIELGMSKPAALAFLTSGSVTSIPAMMAVFPLVKKSVFFSYISIALVSSVIVSYAYSTYLVFT